MLKFILICLILLSLYGCGIHMATMGEVQPKVYANEGGFEAGGLIKVLKW